MTCMWIYDEGTWNQVVKLFEYELVFITIIREKRDYYKPLYRDRDKQEEEAGDKVVRAKSEVVK